MVFGSDPKVVGAVLAEGGDERALGGDIPGQRVGGRRKGRQENERQEEKKSSGYRDAGLPRESGRELSGVC